MTVRRTRFGPLDISFDDEVLEPREWTVEQSRWAAKILPDLPDGPVLELCAGAGQIGLVLAVETGCSLVQVDVDERACRHARANAAAAGIDVEVRCGDLARALRAGERFPFVLADPPYIPSDEVPHLEGDPDGAIDGGEDGLDIARTCLAVAADHLLDDGLVLLQLRSEEQAETLRPDAAEHGLEAVEVRTVGTQGALVLLRRSGARTGTAGG